MNFRGRLALVGAAVAAVSLVGAASADAAGTGMTRVTFVVRPTAPVSTSPVALSSKVKPNPVVGTTMPTGQVCFYDGASTVPIVCGTLAPSAKGIAVVHVKATLAQGVHTLHAQYAGDANYAARASKPVTVTVG
jgi:hypothetical protein